MLPSDLDRYSTPSRPSISPDGSHIAFTVSRMDLEEDRYDNVVWMWDRSRGARPFTSGPGDVAPTWSPDGSQLAFLRSDDGPPQVAVIDLDGGEARIVTDAPKGVRGVQWHPDGERLVVHWVEWEESWAGLDDEERARVPRRVSHVPYRFDTLGWVHTDRHRIALVPTAGGDPEFLTDPLRSIMSPKVTPAGDAVVFLSDLREGLSDMRRAVHRAEADGSGTSEIGPLGSWGSVTVAPDGTVLATGFPDPIPWPSSQTLWRLVDGSWEEVSPGFDRSLVLVFGIPLVPQATSNGAVSVIEDAGKVGLIRIDDDGGVTHLVDGDRAVTGFSATPDGSTVALTISDDTHPGDLWLLGEAGLEQLTTLDPDPLPFVGGTHFTVDGPGGPIDAWMFLPSGDEQVPLLLNIHGGPASQYGFGFFDEFQVYAAAGYGVVACNPRGSSGRGTEWMRSVVGDGWGTNDLEDLRLVVDAALAREPRLDAERMGVMGGSYGGFMTGWILGHEDRWMSAVVERALLSFTSFAGTSDIGHTFGRYYLGEEMPDGYEFLWEKSPQRLSDKVVTPTLIIHSEGDWRCPIEQAEQFLMQLLRNGTPVEMLRFPDESHELSRSGKPKHRKERFEAILDWHGRHLA
ncbi:MAG: S9 family peptidase [Acidimicrobiia bacterium]|nr:MAG: S9 family peptidase [Acidimicrobiia bacterium]